MIAGARNSLVGVPFNQISHRIFRAPTMHDLLSSVVRIRDVSPRHISEIFALFQSFHRFTDLKGFIWLFRVREASLLVAT